MSIIRNLVTKNVVILANNFNASTFNQYWLIKNNFCQESDFLPGTVFNSEIAQILTQKFKLLVLPNQLQFSTTNPEDWDEIYSSTFIKIIEKIPEIPYTASGINYAWHIKSEEYSIEQLSKSLFFIEGNNFFNEFTNDNARFGAYLSKDFNGARLKLDIKPIIYTDVIKNTSEDLIQFAFNYHLDLKSNDRHEELISFLKEQSSYLEHSKFLIELINIS